MWRALGSHLRTNVIGYLALMIALGGTSYAAVNLPAGSVGTPQIKNGAVSAAKVKAGAVTTAKLKNGAVRGAKIANGSVGAAKLAAGAVPAATNVIDVAQQTAVNPLPAPYTQVLAVPGVAPGDYLVQAKAVAVSFDPDGDFTRCRIRVDGTQIDQSNTYVGGGSGAIVAELTMMATVTKEGPFDVDLACGHDNSARAVYVEGGRLQVIRVASVE